MPGSTRSPPGRALWEFTWRCDLRCVHCLVDGGRAHPRELDTDEALSLVDQIAALGVRYVTLSGGEPLLRKDWKIVARRVRARGMGLRLSTNGNLLDEPVLAELLALRTEQVVLSLDGPRQVHDEIRRPGGSKRAGEPSPFEQTMRVLALLRDTPIEATVITSVMRSNLEHLGEIRRLLGVAGTNRWIVQLAHATGRMRNGASAGAPRLLLLPEQMERLAAILLGLIREPGLTPQVFNSVGYLSKEEPLLRSAGRARATPFWRGCHCGLTTMGIEPDGGIKGCANQVGAPFVVGNIRHEPLQAIWDDSDRWHWLKPDPTRMTGVCQGCVLAGFCCGGCTALAFSSTGELFANPYCLRSVRDETGKQGGSR